MSEKPANPASPTLSVSRERCEALISHFVIYVVFLYLWIAYMFPAQGTIVFLFVALIAWTSLKVNPNWLVIGSAGLLVARYGFFQSELSFWGTMVFTLASTILFWWRSRMEVVIDKIEQAICLIRNEESVTWNTFSQDCVRNLLLKGLWMLVLVATSVLLLVNSPFGGGYDRWMKWTMDQRQVLWPGATLIVLILGAAIVLNEWSKRQINSMQARLWLRSDRIRLHYKDLMRVMRVRQILAKRKK
jgi:hypothetical protein